MDIQRIPFADLSSNQLDSWRQLQRGRSLYDSPFLTADFCGLVDRVRSDVEVVVVCDSEGRQGFLPLHRRHSSEASPLAEAMSDVQAWIADPRLHVDPSQLLKSCGIRTWQFDHLLAEQACFRPYHGYLDDAYQVDLAQGFEHYHQQRRAAGSRALDQAARKMRKLADQAGPVRLQWHQPSDERFEQFYQWKESQLIAQGFDNTFCKSWVRQLLGCASRHRSEDLEGQLTVLEAGTTPVAICLGLRSRHVYDCWIPAYNADYAGYSPGLILHSEMIRQAAERGLQRLDLGRGANQLKKSLANASRQLAVGCVDCRWSTTLMRRSWYTLRKWAYASPFKSPLQAAYRHVRNRLATSES